MLQRLFVEKIEHRIIVGTLAFLGIMVLVGWLAINEGGRMQAFDRQFLARSIERGAALYNTNCSSCHGVDGLGAPGRAPALNSPYLFGHDFLAETDREIDALTRERANPASAEILDQIDVLTAERGADTTTPERAAEIDTQIAALQAELELPNPTLPVERVAEIDARLAELATQRSSLISSMQAAVDKGGYDPENPSRLANVGWGGTLNQFVFTTLTHGRPGSAYTYPASNGGMVAWGQLGGGPLRGDQLEDITNFILNWDKGDAWTIEDLLAVQQFPIVPGGESTTVEAPVGTDAAAIETQLASITGDPVNGQAIYTGPLGCVGCHANAAVAPLTETTWPAVVSGQREPVQQGMSPDQYLIHSIVLPNEYHVPPYPGIMPTNFGERLDAQGLADLIAYLKSFDGGATASADGG